MRKIAILSFFILFFSCEKNEFIDFLPNVHVDIDVDLNLPQFIDLQTPTGWVYLNGGYRGVLLQSTGIGNPPYKAFERACPNNDSNIPMNFDGSLKQKCSCDNSEYSIIDGSPQTSGNDQFAREYKVNVISSTSLNISNF